MRPRRPGLAAGLIRCCSSAFAAAIPGIAELLLQKLWAPGTHNIPRLRGLAELLDGDAAGLEGAVGAQSDGWFETGGPNLCMCIVAWSALHLYRHMQHIEMHINGNVHALSCMHAEGLNSRHSTHADLSNCLCTP